MSQSRGTALTYSPDPAGYRLIELPPDLQALLESDNPPVLTLEASDTSALLKTPTKTYALRQKNTSNALMLLSPHDGVASMDPGLAMISTIHDTVELDAVPDKPADTGVSKPTASKGKWHEKFGRNR